MPGLQDSWAAWATVATELDGPQEQTALRNRLPTGGVSKKPSETFTGHLKVLASDSYMNLQGDVTQDPLQDTSVQPQPGRL